jgi:hypothetical protein
MNNNFKIINETNLNLNENYIIYTSYLYNQNNEQIGYFSIEGNQTNNILFNSGNTISMNISIEDEYKKRGLSRLMVSSLLKYCLKQDPFIRKDQLLTIDGDGSGGFWEHIGMKQGRYSYMSNERAVTKLNHETVGYEKEITFSDLSFWALGKRYGI